jgi:hypothetical protein
MGTRQPLKKRLFLHIETLESRVVLSSVTIALGTAYQFGPQVSTVQAYGGSPRVAMGILDTGSSAITFSAADQASFAAIGMPIPILASGAAQAGGIGGYVQGDVSQPGTIYVDGIHALESPNYDSFGFPEYSLNASTPGIQAFVGTTAGSACMPTVTGTAIFNPSATNPQGLAALVALQGGGFGPDVRFVAPTYVLGSQAGTTSVRIPLSLFGSDNYSDPGNQVTVSPVPVDPSISVNANGITARNQEFLFDTGSQLTIISPAMAASLHLNLSHPATTIQIQGIGGTVTVPGFTVHALSVPISGGTLTFSNVPVYVLNVGSGFDGVLGMNLFSRAGSMLYNPYDQGGASLSVNFYANLARLPLASAGGNLHAPSPYIPNPSAMPQPPATSAPNLQPSAGRPATLPRSSLVIIVVGPQALPASPVIASPVILPASPGTQTSTPLFITLQEQPLPVGQPPATTNVAENDARSSGNGIQVMSGYGAVSVSESTPEATGTPEQPATPTTATPPSTPPSDNAPPMAATPPPDAQAEAVTAFFASIPQALRDADDVPPLALDQGVAAEAVTKVAIVMAGLWGSIYQRQPQRTRQPLSSSPLYR